MTFKAEEKSYSSLVHLLPQQGVVRKQATQCNALLKIDRDGNVTFNFCNQKQDFKLNVNLIETRNDIFKMQQQSQLRLMDGRRRNDSYFNLNGNESNAEDREQDEKEKKEKEKGKKAKVINSDEEDDPYSGNDSD